MGTLKKDVIIAIDQGTTGSTVVAMDLGGRTLARASEEFPQHFPAPGLVEHDPKEIWDSVLVSLARVLEELPRGPEAVAALGITNQRETMLVWDRVSGTPVHRALVWQDRRTSARCAELKSYEKRVREVTGLVIDPYFSASKLSWLLAQDPALRRRAEEGSLCFGTIDSFLVHKLGGGFTTEGGGPIIEVTNASRTLLMDLRSLKFSPEMCALWDVPEALLPRIVESAGIFAVTHKVPGLPDGIPISGIAGDQHAALFGQGCVHPGDSKCTYGTGAFVLANTGSEPLVSEAGLLSTLAWQVHGKVTYALEGACFIAGAAVQWLRDGLGVIQSASEVEALARSVSSSEGVSFVPALSGLGAPYWDAEARGLVCGLTRGTTKAHLARATLDAIALQVDDLLTAMDKDLGRQTGGSLTHLRVDGGASRNDLLLSLQAEISRLRVDRPKEVESTARGAGLLAAIGIGALAGVKEASQAFDLDQSFIPTLPESHREKERARWEQAVARAGSSLKESSSKGSP